MRSESVAVGCRLRIGLFEPLSRHRICDWLPLVAPAGLHKRSIPPRASTRADHRRPAIISSPMRLAAQELLGIGLNSDRLQRHERDWPTAPPAKVEMYPTDRSVVSVSLHVGRVDQARYAALIGR